MSLWQNGRMGLSSTPHATARDRRELLAVVVNGTQHQGSKIPARTEVPLLSFVHLARIGAGTDRLKGR